MELRKEEKRINIFDLVIFAACIFINIVAGLFCELEINIIIRNCVFIGIMIIPFLFLIKAEFVLSLDNRKTDFYSYKFILLLLFFFIISCLFVFIPSNSWVFIFLFVSVGLYLGRFSSLFFSLILLSNTFLLTDSQNIFLFLSYLIPGIIAVFLFSYIDEDFKIAYPLTISVLAQFLLLSLNEILLSNTEFSLKLFCYPVMNCIISVILILFALKFFSVKYVYGSSTRLLDVIDPEFDLIIKLKDKMSDEFNITVYTSLLCAKLASQIGVDEVLVKAYAYYCKVGLLCDENSWDSVSDMLNEYNIPIEIKELVHEYYENNNQEMSRETSVLLISETVISAIRFLFKKNPDQEIDYDKLINTLIDKKIESGLFDKSLLSYEDMFVIKRFLSEEKLFYEFLR